MLVIQLIHPWILDVILTFFLGVLEAPNSRILGGNNSYFRTSSFKTFQIQKSLTLKIKNYFLSGL